MSDRSPELRGRLHPLAILVFARKRIGASVLPILVIAFTWRGGLALPVLGGLVAIGLAALVLEWRRFTYRIEGGRLVIERGVLRHTTRVVPLDRIRGVDLQAPWLHRVLGLVQVEVEAAAGGRSAAELTLAAVSAPEGERLRAALLSARGVRRRGGRRASSRRRPLPGNAATARRGRPDERSLHPRSTGRARRDRQLRRRPSWRARRAAAQRGRPTGCRPKRSA